MSQHRWVPPHMRCDDDEDRWTWADVAMTALGVTAVASGAVAAVFQARAAYWESLGARAKALVEMNQVEDEDDAEPELSEAVNEEE